MSACAASTAGLTMVETPGCSSGETADPAETPDVSGTFDAAETPDASGTFDPVVTPDASGTFDTMETPDASGTCEGASGRFGPSYGVEVAGGPKPGSTFPKTRTIAAVIITVVVPAMP